MQARGHWPAGQRRHAGRGVLILIARLRRATRRNARQPVSLRRAAREIGVCDRTVRRWLAEVDYPSAEHSKKIRQWLEDR